MLSQTASREWSIVQPNSRYLVPDLSPQARIALNQMTPRWIFVAESPHLNEIEPEQVSQRRPLCGMAGRQWWGLLSEVLEGKPNTDVSLNHLVDFCQRYGIVVMNAVQYPLDPKIAKQYPDADPLKNLGFHKVSGEGSYKKLKGSPSVLQALQSLHDRLSASGLENIPIHCLGNDAEWFVSKALASNEAFLRVGEKIPHPSAWWRKGGYYGELARDKLERILKT